MRGLSTIPTSAHPTGRRHALGAPRRPQVGLASNSSVARARAASAAPRPPRQAPSSLDRTTEPPARAIRLDPEAIEEIARRVVELLGSDSQSEPRYIDASAVALDLGVERDWVYAHAEDLGAIRLGGPNGRLRFDRQILKERLGGEDAAMRRAPKRSPRRPKVTSAQTQRRASGATPARSPRQQTPGR
jgi:hypothetical protein